MPSTTTYDQADYISDTNRYAGPFCSCGDYSCPAMRDSVANCGNTDTGADVLDLPGSVCPCGDHLCGDTEDRTDCDNPHI